MNKKQKQNLREAILEQISSKQFGPKKSLADIAEVLAYVLLDLGCNALKLENVTQETLQDIADKQKDNPTLAGAFITQAALMLNWKFKITG